MAEGSRDIGSILNRGAARTEAAYGPGGVPVPGGPPDASRPGLGTRILDRMERQGRTLEQLGRAMLPDNVAERMRDTLEGVKEGSGKFAAGLIGAMDPRTEGGRTFWYGTLTGATIAGIRTLAVHAGAAEMGEAGVVIAGALAGGLKDGITEKFFRSKDNDKVIGAILAGTVIGGLTAYGSYHRPHDVGWQGLGAEAIQMGGPAVLAGLSTFIRKASAEGLRSAVTWKTMREAALSGVMAGAFTGLADYLFAGHPKPEGGARAAEPSSGAPSIENDNSIAPAAPAENDNAVAPVPPAGAESGSVATPAAAAPAEAATNTPTPTRTPEAVAPAPDITSTPTSTPTAQPIPTKEEITGIPSATPTATATNTPIPEIATNTPTPTATTQVSVPGAGLPGPGSAPADVPGSGEVQPWPTATATVQNTDPFGAPVGTEAPGAGGKSWWDSVKEWWNRPPATPPPATGDNIIDNDNAGSGAPDNQEPPLAGPPAPYSPRAEDLGVVASDPNAPVVINTDLDRNFVLVRPGENLDTSLGHEPGSMYSVVNSPTPIETPGVEGQTVPSGIDSQHAAQPAAPGPATGVNPAPAPDAAQPGAPASGEAPGAGAAPEAAAAAGTVEQAIASFDKEIPLPKGETPWIVAEQLLKQANPNGEFTPSDIMAVDKALILAQVDPQTGEGLISVPEWGIEGKSISEGGFMANNLPEGMKFQITDEVKQAVLAAAKK